MKIERVRRWGIVALGVALLLVALFGWTVTHAATVTLQWPEGTNADHAGYRLYRADTNCARALTYKVVKTWAREPHDAPRLSTVTDEVGDGAYCYRMTAFSIAGTESDPSNTAEIIVTNRAVGNDTGLKVLSVKP